MFSIKGKKKFFILVDENGRLLDLSGNPTDNFSETFKYTSSIFARSEARKIGAKLYVCSEVKTNSSFTIMQYLILITAVFLLVLFYLTLFKQNIILMLLCAFGLFINQLLADRIKKI